MYFLLCTWLNSNRFYSVLRLLVLIALSNVLAACGGGSGGGGGSSPAPAEAPPLAADSVEYLRYAAGRGDLVEFVYPDGWIKDSDPDNGLVVAYMSPVENAEDRFREGVFFFSFNYEELIEDEGFEDLVLISEAPVTISGFQALEYVFEGTIPGESLRLKFRAIELDINDSNYIFMYAAQSSQYARYEQIADYVIDTISIGAELYDLAIVDSGQFPERLPVSSDGENFLVMSCRSEYRQELNRDVEYVQFIGALVSSGGELLKQVEISPSFSVAGWSYGCDNAYPTVYFGGNAYLAVFAMAGQDDFEGGLYAVRLDRSGTLLDPVPVLLSSIYTFGPADNAYARGKHPDIAFDGVNYLVVYNESVSDSRIVIPNDGLFAVLVPQTGTPQAPFIIKELNEGGFWSTETHPQVSYMNGQYWVAWDEPVWQSDNEVYGTLVSTQGLLIDSSPTLLGTTLEDVTNFDLQSSGQSLLLAWGERLNASSGNYNFQIARFTDFDDFQSGSVYRETAFEGPLLEENSLSVVPTSTGYELFHVPTIGFQLPDGTKPDEVFRKIIRDQDAALSPQVAVGSLLSFYEKGLFGLFTVAANEQDLLFVYVDGQTLSGWLLSNL
jgi:hypothetical protein